MNIWSTVLESLKKRVSPQAYNDWLRPTYEISQDDKQVRVKVPNDRFREHIKDQYIPLIEDILAQRDLRHIHIDFVTDSGPTQLSLHQEEKRETEFQVRPPLNPLYSVDEFVAGPFNQFAHAAALAVASNLSRAYNPLFIYGGSGLGKTHLLHAIGLAAFNTHPKMRLIYISTEEFTNEF